MIEAGEHHHGEAWLAVHSLSLPANTEGEVKRLLLFHFRRRPLCRPVRPDANRQNY